MGILFGKVELRKPIQPFSSQACIDESVAILETSTPKNPVRLVSTTVADWYQGRSTLKDGTGNFVVSGKADIHRLDHLIKRFTKAFSQQAAKALTNPPGQPDFTQTHAAARAVIQFLYTQAGLSVPKTTRNLFQGTPLLQAWYTDTGRQGRSVLAAFWRKHGTNWIPYQPKP